MEKDSTTHRRHRPGPGALPSGITSGYLKVASEGAELQRSRSVGGLHQKGDPPVCIRKLLPKELDSEDQGKDPRSDPDDTTCQVSLEEDRKKENQDEPEKLDQKCEKTEPGKSSSEASATEQDEAHKGRCTSVTEVHEPESMKLNNLLEKQKPSVFVEIDLGDHTEEVVTCAIGEEKRHPMDTGDLSEDETRTSWVCCIPYYTKRKVKEATNALEKGQSDSSQRRPKAGTLLQPKVNNRDMIIFMVESVVKAYSSSHLYFLEVNLGGFRYVAELRSLTINDILKTQTPLKFKKNTSSQTL